MAGFVGSIREWHRENGGHVSLTSARWEITSLHVPDVGSHPDISSSPAAQNTRGDLIEFPTRLGDAIATHSTGAPLGCIQEFTGRPKRRSQSVRYPLFVPAIIKLDEF
jgi:hypothetical protein